MRSNAGERIIGDRSGREVEARAEAWFRKYDVIPQELKAVVKQGVEVPVDIDPVFSFKEGSEVGGACTPSRIRPFLN